jgi:hypothetical protein
MIDHGVDFTVHIVVGNVVQRPGARIYLQDNATRIDSHKSHIKHEEML